MLEIVTLVEDDETQGDEQCVGGDNTSTCDCDGGGCMCDTD